MNLSDGQVVDVLQEQGGLLVVRTQQAPGDNSPLKIGYFPVEQLLTEEEIYAKFMYEEELRLAKELEDAKLADEAKTQAYEENLRQKSAPFIPLTPPGPLYTVRRKILRSVDPRLLTTSIA